MISFPNCKINLGLNIVRRRDDGYHDIESIMYPVPITDILEIVLNEESKENFSFTSTGLKIPGKESDNLCVKAYQLLKNDFNLPPVKMHLHKIIPMGGGLGGGSANGAYTISLLNDLFDLKLSTSKKQRYALQLGSDCPFFIDNKPQLARGRGEELTKINLSLANYYLVLLNVGIHISTQEAYQTIKPKGVESNLEKHINQPIREWRNLLVNDFEEGFFKNYPALKKYKQMLYEKGALYASMTGSGSTLFGVFETKPINISEPKNGFLRIVKV